MLNRVVRVLRRYGGVRGAVRAVVDRARHPHPRCLGTAREMVGGRGLEIGGPSKIFQSRFPLYETISALDNCNFAHQTVWEGTIAEGQTFLFHPDRQPGWQHIADASALPTIPDGAYQFLLASHAIEHLANPVKALREWMRVVVPGGSLILVIPHKDGTFDHHRPVTSVEHMLEDAERDTAEDDLTHVPEILALHDLSMDPGAGSAAAFHARCLKNAEHRCLHHHTFTLQSAVALAQAVGLKVRVAEAMLGCHIILLATTPAFSRDEGRPPIIYPSPFESD